MITDQQRLQNQLHQIALLHTALRHARDALSEKALKDIGAEIDQALDASEGTAVDIVEKLTKKRKPGDV